MNPIRRVAGAQFLAVVLGCLGYLAPPAGAQAGAFQAGAREIYSLDLAGTPAGGKPKGITQIITGEIRVVDKGGVRMIKSAAPVEFLIELPEKLPERFTLEFDVVARDMLIAGAEFAFEGTPRRARNERSAEVIWSQQSVQIVGGKTGQAGEIKLPDGMSAELTGQLTEVRVAFDGPAFKLLTNGTLVYDLPELAFPRLRVLRVYIHGVNDTLGAVYLAKLRIAEGGGVAAGTIAQQAPAAPPPPAPAPISILPAAPPTPTAAPATVSSAQPSATPGDLGRVQPPAMTRLNDAPAPEPVQQLGAYGAPAPPGVLVVWAVVPSAVRYTICRESPLGGTCVDRTPAKLEPLPEGALVYADADVTPGMTYGYRVSAYRADGHYGISAPVVATAGEWVAPKNLRIVEERLSENAVVLAWDPVMYFPTGSTGVTAPLGRYQLLGSSLSSAQIIEGTRATVTLTTGVNSWQVFPAYPNPAGGIFTSKAPATLDFGNYRFRLVALGFKVMQQSEDDVLERDGKGDEVYVAAVVGMTTRALSGVAISTTRGATLGDARDGTVFPGRLPAGSASPSGGIVTGDLIPASLNLSGAAGTPSMTAFPLLLWEGLLTDDKMVLVHPSIWEEDADKAAYAAWVNRVTARAQSNYSLVPVDRTQILQLRDQSLLGPAVNEFKPGTELLKCWDQVNTYMDQKYDCVPGQDRPVGLTPGISASAYLVDRKLVLTRAAIEKALTGTGPRAGVPPGVIIIPLFETGVSNRAMYELYLRVERVN